jgi:hypothetical protein
LAGRIAANKLDLLMATWVKEQLEPYRALIAHVDPQGANGTVQVLGEDGGLEDWTRVARRSAAILLKAATCRSFLSYEKLGEEIGILSRVQQMFEQQECRTESRAA